MNTETYTLKHFNNTLDVFLSEEKLYTSKWFMDFGKFGSEVFNSKDEIVYHITKKFKFWKWKMVFTIKNENGILKELTSQNNKKTIYSIIIENQTYTIKIHYKKRFSIFKNGDKIAEIDASFTHKNFQKTIKLQLLDRKDLEISFLLFSCLKIGEVEERSKAIITSQKQLEINIEPWD
ncbi:hypothetical protein [uncultured Polaribacter sp.]|uniref:tubby C-terminal domain-like protein n=1 Tax=uncultured Polaribacter sp. TaxID=174711 RepID=UPI002603A5EA|nr:hypothetical protein [uncultured Polaribacter sp.]